MFLFFKKRESVSFESNAIRKRILGKREVHTAVPRIVFKRSFLWQKMIFGVAVIFFAAMIFYFLFISSYFKITDIAVTGVRESVADKVKEDVQKHIDSMRIKNIFLLRPRVVEKNIKEKFYLLKSARVHRKLPGIIKIEGEEKTPTAIIHSGQRYYFLDNESLVFEEISLTRLAVTKLPIIENKGSNKNVKMGDRILSSRFMDFVISLQDILPRETGLEITEISIPAFASREVHVRVRGNFIVYFDIQRTVESQIKALKKTLSEVITSEELKNLQYIDLRVENKVFYYPTT